MVLGEVLSQSMLIKDLIELLQKHYEEEMKHVDVLGEPEIMIDVFDKVEDHKFHYSGFSNKITIERSSDGVYLILSAFKETYDEQRVREREEKQASIR